MQTAHNTFRTWLFGEFTLDGQRGALLKDGGEIKLRPQSFEVLRYLVENHGRLVSKEELQNRIWRDTVVTDGSLTQCLIDVRRAIGDADDPDGPATGLHLRGACHPIRHVHRKRKGVASARVLPTLGASRRNRRGVQMAGKGAKPPFRVNAGPRILAGAFPGFSLPDPDA